MEFVGVIPETPFVGYGEAYVAVKFLGHIWFLLMLPRELGKSLFRLVKLCRLNGEMERSEMRPFPNPLLGSLLRFEPPKEPSRKMPRT
ncbi:MAG: hypothetical protein CMF45_08770 [Legionellales bacterium]|nr:hypothetical protein [Legionellales bacterium]